MNIRHNPELRERLAAEYVLGTLRGGARRRFESWLRDDAALRHTVEAWRDRLYPLAEFAPPIQPSPQAWHAIESRLGLPAARGGSSFWRDMRESLNFWRGLSVASTALAMVLVAALVLRQPEPALSPPSYVALLTDDRSQAAIVVTGDAKSRRLIVKVVAPQTIAADKSLQLWALPQSGAPRSLGLVAPDGTITLPLPENLTPQAAPALAVSLEPKGGSPNPQGPSGPILFKGAWVGI